MKITRLWLLNFRNYENATLDFADNNLIVGTNGAGKTNVLEAIDILATSRSKIVNGLNKCIRYGQPGFAINGRFDFAQRPSLTVALRQERGAGRVIKINEETLSRASELLGRVNSVLFLPSDLEIIHGQPVQRRKYLDIVISQAEPEYCRALQIYVRALKQRNELLKNMRNGQSGDLSVWDAQLADCAAQVKLKRQEYLEFFARETAQFYNAMGFAGQLTLKYKTKTLSDKQKNLEVLQSSRAEDLRFGRTHFGPHTDDFEVYLDENKAAEFCSQGQKRLISIAFKCAEAKIKRQKLDDPPIVLIDDVLLELDLVRLNKIIAAIAPRSQKIFTVTDTGRFAPELLKDMRIIKLENGRLV
ncbi:DNA recombination protein RecF [Candidatus Termititenax aidoneus]|uniref:DNA replication and repair protein RecF n=1 Tax=Termititenax aidoneus TaxID=2218524 RepID=A0A388T9Q6_TERA1|nr:DNA recombination protein RecF [Candidatus Termititenax aidoneus]